MQYHAKSTGVGIPAIAAWLLLCLATLRTLAVDSPDKNKNPTGPPAAPPLTCTIHSEATCELGTAPAISVEITNWTDHDIYLVGSLGGSGRKWRYPLCYFEVIGPDGTRVKPGIARCGNMNSIRDKDFVKVPPGGKFDPYQKIDDRGFFGPLIIPSMFAAEGKYRIRFVYSTEKADPKYWLGDVHGEAAEIFIAAGSAVNVVNLLATVPKTTVCSNEISVTVVRPTK